MNLAWVPEWAVGGGTGAVLTGLVASLARSIERRVSASAAQDEAAAYGFRALADQVKALSERCDSQDKRIDELTEQLEGERQQREYWQGRFHETFAELTSTRQAAMRLRAEWEADKARPSVKSERPGPGSQRKA